VPQHGEQPPLVGGVRPALNLLERTLATSRQPVADLRRMADPRYLHLLFRLQLYALIRGGPLPEPSRGLPPRRLLSVAQEAAEAGVLPLTTPFVLRRDLEEAEASLHAAGAWRPGELLWWHPLPAATDLLAQWAGWHSDASAPVALPRAERIAAVFSVAPAAPRFLALPGLLDLGLVRQLHGEVAAAHRDGEIELERAGVGPEGALSIGRWDWASYFSGREPKLLRAAPRFAAFVQWCLEHLEERLAAAVPGGSLHAPQAAMLARYPAPSGGYHPHVDNPGGEADNGRTLTLVIYLNPPDLPCAGGSLSWWAPEAPPERGPQGVVPARGGSAVLFDARSVVHQVQPLQGGPDRWALTIWFSDIPQQPVPVAPLPPLTLTDVLLPVEQPPLPPGVVLLHELDEGDPAGRITVRQVGAARPRVGLVSTVYRGGSALDAWCAHHYDVGMDHILLVFDHLDEPAEEADAARLSERYPSSRLTIWSGERLAADGWSTLPVDDHVAELRAFAHLGSSSVAVAARQALNASVALQCAKGAEFGGAPLDWLLHLDTDELFYLPGPGRGGRTVTSHFAAVSAAGFQLVRYLNHELLLPIQPGAGPRFKVNPRLAAVQLGAVGWSKLVQLLERPQPEPRPYFAGYQNGKSALRVSAGVMAGGVHSWFLEEPLSTSNHCLLAGPWVLHFHLPSPAAFRTKYLARAGAPESEKPRLFAPSPTEVAALDLIRPLRATGADEDTIARHLDALHSRLTAFSEEEVGLLDEAGLTLVPRLRHPLPLGPVSELSES
jgi:hypothetical protein